MQAGVVTIYCCGTGGHRDKHSKWAVPYLHKITKGERKFICDGPGSAKSIKKLENVMKAVESGGKVNIDAKRGSGWFAQKFYGATGQGTADNIVMCMQWLWLEWYKQPFVDINLVGWSRGAVTCIMLAHAIHESGMNQQGNLRVNIFTFDPVPGGKNDFAVKGDFASTGRVGTPDELAPIVASYRSILQENIKKMLMGIGSIGIKKDKNFVCTVPHYIGSHPAQKPLELYPLPGGHGDAGKYNEAEGGGCVGRIGMHLAQSFLVDHGTEFDENHLRSPKQLAEDYAEARMQYTKKNSLRKKPASKYRLAVVANHYRDDLFYVNAHHAGLVEQVYPNIAAYLAGNGRVDGAQKEQFAGIAPKTYSALTALGLLS